MKVIGKLKFVSFENIESWSAYNILEKGLTFSNRYKLVKIKSFLSRNKTPIKIEEDTYYKRPTIKINGGGVFLRDEVKGEKIGTKNQFLIREGQFLLSKIDARNGAFGVVPEGLDKGIITGNFWTFDVDYNLINPYFLQLITRTKQFQNLSQSASVGTTNRNYLQEESFLNFHIPLPSISEQEAIVKNYYDKITQATTYEQQAETLEKNIETYLFETLGIEQKTKEKTKKKGLQFVELREMDRWDIFSINEQRVNSKYSKLKFGDIILGKPTYGANVKGVKKKSDTRYIRITDINENGTLNDDFVSPEFIEEKYLLKENDFLIARSGNTVGKTFLYDDSYGRAIYAGYLVKYKLDLNIVSPQDILAYTKFSLFKQWVVSNQRVSGQPNINGQEYLEAPFIVPPLPKQNEIVATIATMKQEQKNKIERATLLKQQAEREFEQMIFS